VGTQVLGTGLVMFKFTHLRGASFHADEAYVWQLVQSARLERVGDGWMAGDWRVERVGGGK
jgi:hypothetical protein